MPRYVVLLRGINVGRGRQLRMVELRELLEAAGATEVATYIQSGNIVLTHKASAAKLAAELEERIARLAGFVVPVVVLSSVEWRAMIASNPFADDGEHVHASFLATAPPADALSSVIDASSFRPERFVHIGRVVYLQLPGGMGKSKLAVAMQRHKTAGAGTTRNWRTVLAIDALI